jgi:hypothetical protein
MIKHTFVKCLRISVVKHYLSIKILLYAATLVGTCFILMLVLTPSPAQAAAPCSTAACQVGSNDANHGSANPNTGSIKIPFGLSSLVAFTAPKYTVDAPGMGFIWLSMVGVVDIFMTLMFTLTAIRVMVSGSVFRYADVAEAVPRMLLALITAHISFAIIGFFLGLNNALCNALLVYAGEVKLPMQVNDIFNFGTAINFSVWNMVTGDASYVLRFIIQVCFFLVKLIMTLMFISQMVIRIIMIDLYIIFSAPCIACSALPGRAGQPVTRMWLQGFLTLAFVQMVQVGGLIVAEIIGGLITTDLNPIINAAIPHWLNFSAQDVSTITTSFLGIITLWFMLKVPGLLQAAPMQTISAGGGMVGAMASTVAGGSVGAAVLLAK